MVSSKKLIKVVLEQSIKISIIFPIITMFSPKEILQTKPHSELWDLINGPLIITPFDIRDYLSENNDFLPKEISEGFNERILRERDG